MTRNDIACRLSRLNLTRERLRRLHAAAWDRMARGDGYQPWGYDRPTLQITRPDWLKTIDAIALVHDATA